VSTDRKNRQADRQPKEIERRMKRGTRIYKREGGGGGGGGEYDYSATNNDNTKKERPYTLISPEFLCIKNENKEGKRR